MVLWMVFGSPANDIPNFKVSISRCGPSRVFLVSTFRRGWGGGELVSMMGRGLGPIGFVLMVKNDDRKL